MTMITGRPSGMVYIMTNAANGNEVAAFRRMADGTLAPAGMYGTNGNGSGPRGVSPMPGNGVDPLMSQGSLALSRDGRLLFAVNAGSNSVSCFLVSADGLLTLAGRTPTGARPVCACSIGGLLYVAHAGSDVANLASGVSGYTVDGGGRLAIIRGSGRALSTAGAHPAGISVSPDGRFIVVSELNTDRLTVFGVGSGGILSRPMFSASSGRGPFGSLFLSSGVLLVAEAMTNALASYTLGSEGRLGAVSSAPNGQMATCWVAATPDERYAYTSNAASGTLSLFGISANGVLRGIENVMSTGQGPMGAPIDIGVSRDGRNLYALNGNQGSVSVFGIGADGLLELRQVLTRTGLPALGTQGIAVI